MMRLCLVGRTSGLEFELSFSRLVSVRDLVLCDVNSELQKLQNILVGCVCFDVGLDASFERFLGFRITLHEIGLECQNLSRRINPNRTNQNFLTISVHREFLVRSSDCSPKNKTDSKSVLLEKISHFQQ